MRILILSSEFPPGPGGIGTHAFEIARHLFRLGWGVGVAASQDYAAPGEIESFNAAQPFRIFPFERGRTGVGKLATRLLCFRRAIRNTRPDVLLASGKGAVWLAAFTQAYHCRPWLAVGHGTEFGITTPHRSLLTRWAFQRATGIVSVSEYTRGQMIAMGIRPRRDWVVHNGADADSHRQLPAEMVARFRAEQGFGAARLLLTVGRLSPRKGQEVVIQALPKVIRHMPDVHYLMAGLSEQKKPLVDLAHQLGVAAHVHFLGRVDADTLLKLENTCDVFVMTSRHTEDGDFEGYGIAVIEAALCGKPAVVSRGSGLTEAIVEEETGLAVPQNDPDATADAILTLLKDEERRRNMGASARRRAVEEQTWARRVKQYDALLREVTEGNPVSSSLV